mgnify:CR=1 FL=1
MALLALGFANWCFVKPYDARIWYNNVINWIWRNEFMIELQINLIHMRRGIELPNVTITVQDGTQYRNIENMEHFLTLASSEQTIEIRQITNDKHGFIVWKWKPQNGDGDRNTWVCTLNDVPIRTTSYMELQKMFSLHYFYIPR